MKSKKNIIVLISAAVIIRMIALNLNISYETDINCFKHWSAALFRDGLNNFYLSNLFTDYPPGYMYVLWFVGFLQNLFSIPLESFLFTVLIKLPAIICDIMAGYFIYILASKKIAKYALPIALAYVLNPAVVIDSSVWGQVDALVTLTIISSIYLLTNRKLLSAYLIFAVGILFKPQVLMFAPIYMFSAYSFLAENKFSSKSFLLLAKYIAICLGLIIAGILPFTKNLDFTPVINQYVNTITSYPYASLNAYNFYSLVGANWADVTHKVLFFSYSVWGTLFIVAIVVLSLYLLYKNSTKGNYFYVAGLINALTFMFSTRMHERYIFPTFALFLVSFIYLPMQYKKNTALLYVGFSVTMLVNCIAVLYMVYHGNYAMYLKSTISVFSFINLVLTVLMLVTAFDISDSKDKLPEASIENTPPN